LAFEVLLIDSSESDRNDIGSFLESLGYKINYAGNSQEGLKQFDIHKPDLVIVEVLISGPTNGLQVCKSIKTGGSEWVKVIITSKLYQSRAMAKDAVDKYKADAYIEKPFAMQRLYDLIGQFIGKPELKKVEKTEEEKRKRRKKAVKKKKKVLKKPAAAPEKIPFEKKKEEWETKTMTSIEASLSEPDFDSRGIEESSPIDILQDVIFKEPPEASKTDITLAPEGYIERKELGALLRTVFKNNINGVLILDYHEGIKHIYLIDGVPVFIQSNIRKESLGQILLSENHITQEQYEDVLAEAASSKRKVGSICVRKGYLSSTKLHKILSEQTTIKLANCFRWIKGFYKLDLDRKYPPNAPIFETTPVKIILMAYNHYYPMEELRRFVAGDKEKIVFAGKDEIFKNIENDLDENQINFVRIADGTRTLWEVIGQSGFDEAKGIRLAYALMAMGVFKLGSIKREKELGRYSPDPAFDELKEDPLKIITEKINELYIRLENEDDFTIFRLDRNASEKDLEKQYTKMKKEFDKSILPKGSPPALYSKLDKILLHLEKGYKRLWDSEGRKTYIDSLDKQLREESTTKALTDEELQDKAPSTIVAELAFQKGIFAMEKGKYYNAVDYFQKACDLAPETGEYYIRLGFAIFMKITNPGNTLEQGIKNIEKGLSLSPGDLIGYQKLAQIEIHQGNYNKGKKLLEHVIRIDPDDQETAMEIAEIEELLSIKGKE